jgi:hypothetical protein
MIIWIFQYTVYIEEFGVVSEPVTDNVNPQSVTISIDLSVLGSELEIGLLYLRDEYLTQMAY